MAALLEREKQLEALQEQLTEVESGHGRVVLVSGEAGIGKTSLMAAFAASCRPQVRVLWGACDALFTPRPLGPIHDMAPQFGPDPEHGLRSLLSAGLEGPRLFSSILAEFGRGSEPTMVVFEDLHWADEATLDLLKYVGRRIERVPALLVLTYRDDELGTHHPLRLVLGELLGPDTKRLSLSPLSHEAVASLARAAGRSDKAEDLYAATGGNPFLVTEILAGGAVGIPATVRDAVLTRVLRLSPAGRAVLEAAAIIGPRIDPAFLTSVEPSDSSAVDESLASGVLASQGAIFVFRHELSRQAILEAMAPHRRLRLHRAVLDALRQAGSEDFGRLAHHAEAALDSEAVLSYAPRAAAAAAAANAHREAATLYALASRHAGRLPPGEQARIFEAYAWECNLVDRREEGVAARRRADALWESLGDSLRQGENLTRMVIMLGGVGEYEEAERVSRRAVELLEQLPPGPELALAYRSQSTLALLRRDIHDCIAWGEKAERLAEAQGDAITLALARNTVGTAWLLVDFDRGRSILEANIASALEAGRDAHAANSYTNLGAGSAELFHLAEARQIIGAAIALCEERDFDAMTLYLLAWKAHTDLFLGDWAEAGDAADIVAARPGASVNSRFVALAVLGRLRARRGDPGVAAALDEALALAAKIGSVDRLAAVRCARAEAAWLAGDKDAASAEARAVYPLTVEKEHPWFAGELAYWLRSCGDNAAPPGWIARPFALELGGNWREAAQAWREIGCPYEQARALANGDRPAQLAALEIFDRFGSCPAGQELRRTLRSAGVRGLSRGPRASTRGNPLGLTSRETEILSLLASGSTNAEIAARLYISRKTVDHHVSAILGKLQVSGRREAAQVAARLGLTSR